VKEQKSGMEQRLQVVFTKKVAMRLAMEEPQKLEMFELLLL
jgi:hypothetical protein